MLLAADRTCPRLPMLIIQLTLGYVRKAVLSRKSLAVGECSCCIANASLLIVELLTSLASKWGSSISSAGASHIRLSHPSWESGRSSSTYNRRTADRESRMEPLPRRRRGNWVRASDVKDGHFGKPTSRRDGIYTRTDRPGFWMSYAATGSSGSPDLKLRCPTRPQLRSLRS
jgi:hypothetical protein